MLVPIAAVRIINHALYSSHQRTPGFTISVLYYLCTLRVSLCTAACGFLQLLCAPSAPAGFLPAPSFLPAADVLSSRSPVPAGQLDQRRINCCLRREYEYHTQIIQFDQ